MTTIENSQTDQADENECDECGHVTGCGCACCGGRVATVRAKLSRNALERDDIEFRDHEDQADNDSYPYSW